MSRVMSKVTEVVGRKFTGRKNKEQGCTHKKKKTIQPKLLQIQTVSD